MLTLLGGAVSFGPQFVMSLNIRDEYHTGIYKYLSLIPLEPQMLVTFRKDIFILENHTRIEKRNKKTKEESEDGKIVYVLQHFEMTKCTSTVRTNKCSSLLSTNHINAV